MLFRDRSPHLAPALAGRRLASALAIAAAGMAGCKSAPRADALLVGVIVVGEAGLAGKPEIGETPERVRRELQHALESTGRFAFREGAPARVHLEIEQAQRRLAPLPLVHSGQQQQGEREMAEVYLMLELTLPEGDRLLAEGEARRPTNADDSLDPAARHAAFGTALDAAIGAAVAALRDQVDARRKTDAELLADLGSPEPRVRDYAIRVLADRRSPSAVPFLIERLHDDNPEVAKRAAGALTAIGDRRAVGPLIELTRKRDAEHVGPLLYAIATLGGPEAEAFLYTLESGSPDEEIRRAARGAYADLLRRKQDESARAAGHTAGERRDGTP